MQDDNQSPLDSDSVTTNIDEQADAASLLSPRKIVVQILGFLVGIALLYWCVAAAIKQGDWSLLADADPLLILGLVACSFVSLTANGALFWLIIRPLHPLRMRDMQMLNFAVSFLNYAPIRLGLISRIAYHLRVDRMPLLQVFSWLAAIAFVMLLCLGSCIAATLVRGGIDIVWLLILLGLLLLGGLLAWATMNQSIVVKYGRGLDQMLSNPISLWGSIGLRMVDIAAFVGRMACAAAILQLDLPAQDVLLLAFAAVTFSLVPFGRLGFREAGVALIAGMLTSDTLTADDLQGRMAQLALIDSAGEVLVTVPLGVIAVIWYRAKWKAAGADE